MSVGPRSIREYADGYLTVADVADVLRVSPKRVRNMMSSGIFRPGVHFVRRCGLGPRFIRSHLEAWLRDDDKLQGDTIPMARRRGGRTHHHNTD